MSYTKDHLGELPLSRVHRDMKACERRAERAMLERLAWEAQRAVDDYLAALKVYEQHRNEDASRRASADFKAGTFPI